MKQTDPAVKDLARRLLLLEANPGEHAEGAGGDALKVFEKLRSHLSRLVGVAGFQALLARALALAKSETSWLEAVRVQPDGTLEGFREAARRLPAEAVTDGSAALLAHLLGLLVTFVGEALTLRLVADIWPQARLDNVNLSPEETPA